MYSRHGVAARAASSVVSPTLFCFCFTLRLLFQIDLDTIDVSNLNRQFLFHKQHVGKSKAKVARESALQFNPDAEIEAIHDSIIK